MTWITVPHGALEVAAVVGRASLTDISSVAGGTESRLGCAVVVAGRTSSSTDISSVAGGAESRLDCAEVPDAASETSPGSWEPDGGSLSDGLLVRVGRPR